MAEFRLHPLETKKIGFAVACPLPLAAGSPNVQTEELLWSRVSCRLFLNLHSVVRTDRSKELPGLPIGGINVSAGIGEKNMAVHPEFKA